MFPVSRVATHFILNGTHFVVNVVSCIYALSMVLVNQKPTLSGVFLQMRSGRSWAYPLPEMSICSFSVNIPHRSRSTSAATTTAQREAI